MKVSDVMSPDFEVVPVDASVMDAARIIAELDTPTLPVGTVEALKGVVTERDITVRVVAEGANPAETRVGAIMSSHVFTCRADDPVEKVAKEMRQRKVRQLPVLDADGKLVGLVTAAALTAPRPGDERPAAQQKGTDSAAVAGTEAAAAAAEESPQAQVQADPL